MGKFWAQPLRRQLFIANLLLLVPVLGATIWFGVSMLREPRQDIGRQADVVARTTAAYINRDFVTVDRMAQRLAREPVVVAMDPVRVIPAFERSIASQPMLLRIVLSDATGREVGQLSAADGLLLAAAVPADVLRDGRRIITPTQFARSSQMRYVILGYPVAGESGAVIGSLAFYITIETLQDAFVALPLPDGSVVAIADDQGRVLARSVDAERHLGRLLYDAPRDERAAPSSSVRTDPIDGVERMYSEAGVAAAGFLVSVGIPVSVATGQVVSVWGRSLAVLMIGLAGWFVVALVLSRRLSASVSHLDATAQRIASGDFAAMQPKPMLSRELTDLQRAFGRMLQRFNDTRQAVDAKMAEERRIRQELESLQGQVIRQERLAAVGQLVSGVAHEINNPLQAILGFAELLQMQPDVPESVKSDLRLIQKESARACGIIRNLAMFARQQPGEAASVRLVDVVTSVAELRQRRLESEDIELRIEDTSRQHVLAVMTELQQVVLNFVVNAEQAIVTSGRLPGRITVRTYDRDERSVLEVEDTGPGVPSTHEARLFQPFFTTKPVGQGTGLGLSVSYGIVDSLGGHIGYRRAPAGGAIFYFDLPTVIDAQA